MDIVVITEGQVELLADYPSLIAAMDDVFIACAREHVENFQPVRSYLRDARGLFSIKSGCNYSTRDLGLKCGGYWERNVERDFDRHQSTVLLLDIETGRPRALVAGNNLTAFRTAATAAAAARRLARPGAKHVAILGAGRQALFQLQALREVRPIRQVSVWSRSSERAKAFAEKAGKLDLIVACASTPAEATSNADIVVTVTPANKPLIGLADVSPGVHINAMGSDTQGKHELSLELLKSAKIWTDDIQQAAAVGECQHLPSVNTVSHIGSLLIEPTAFQRRDNDITIYDGTGLALQDLAAANLILTAAVDRGLATRISI